MNSYNRMVVRRINLGSRRISMSRHLAKMAMNCDFVGKRRTKRAQFERFEDEWYSVRLIDKVSSAQLFLLD